MSIRIHFFLAAHRRVATLLLSATAMLAGCSDGSAPEIGKARATTAGGASSLIARGKVELPGGALPITAPVSGQLASIVVSEGDHVAAGATLALIDPTAATLELKQAEARLQRAVAVHQATTHAIADTQRQMQRLAHAAAEGAIDLQSADTAQALHRQRSSEQLIAAREIDIARAARDLQRHTLAQHTLRAPQAGTVVRLDATAGRWVDSTTHPLLMMLPDVPPQVRAEVNESLAGRVHDGMRATVVAEGATADSGVPAHVLHVSPMFAASRLDDDHPVRRNLRVIETLLTLDSGTTLRPGQNVSVLFHE